MLHAFELIFLVIATVRACMHDGEPNLGLRGGRTVWHRSGASQQYRGEFVNQIKCKLQKQYHFSPLFFPPRENRTLLDSNGEGGAKGRPRGR